MTREHILSKINKIIEEEHGESVTEEDLLADCGIDSFGYAMLWLGMENDIVKTPDGAKVFSKEYLDAVDYSTLTVADVITVIEKAYDVYK